MGKTAFALSSAKVMAEQNIPVGILSLEMSKNALTKRIVSMVTRINGQDLRTGKLSPEEIEKLNSSFSKIEKLPIYIDDSSDLCLAEIKVKINRMMLKYKVQVVFIDYLQLINSQSTYSREQEVAKISRGLKNMAKEFNIPIVILSQLNRDCESRANARPKLSDLRDSGSLEQDADVVIFVHRPEYYDIKEMYNKTSSVNKAEIIVAKQRNGPTGTFIATFLKDHACFCNHFNGGESAPF
jgi:replicative DNA helicase